MALVIPDKWVWDFWFAKDGPDYHIFYLQAPSDLANETMRHFNVSVGHAVGQDLVNWTILPDALAPAPAESDAWDNYTTWTGSVLKHDGRWHMLYTGSNRGEEGLIQRIGLATSEDLITWTKHPQNPVLETDPRYYEELDRALWHDQAWRDPWLFHHEGRIHAFITARGLTGEPSGRGVVGHAVSTNFVDWECRPSVAHPGDFGHMEVPQVVEIQGRWYLFFCVGYGQFSKARQAHSPKVIGTHYLLGESRLGPFEMIEDDFLLADEAGSLYAGKAIQNPEGEWVMMVSRAWTGDGGFTGQIADPMPLTVLPDGRLRVERETGA